MKRCLSLLLAVILLLSPCMAASEYAVSAGTDAHGTVQLSVTHAKAGETVTGTVSPAAGYAAATVRVEQGGSYFFAQLSDNRFSFRMPKGDVTVKAAFFSETVWDGAVDISWYDPAAQEYEIGTPAALAGLAALVNGMTDKSTPDYLIKGDASQIAAKAYGNVLLVGAGGGNVSDTVYCSDLDFAYKTVYLTADLDMGGVQAADGSWFGPNWTPIGGKYAMSPETIEGDCYVLDTRFNGVLDGQGHTVKNICCLRYAAKGFPYSMAIGLVGYLGGAGDVSGISADFENGWQPAVRNVTVGRGYIYGRRMVAGVVGRIGKTGNGVIVENCANFADVLNTDAKGVGGIVGAGWGKGTIRNCYNAGSISTIFSCPAGGICASNSGLEIRNCYNVGTISSNGAVRGRAIGGHDSGTYSVLNCYYLEGCDDDPASGGWYAGTSAAKLTLSVTALRESEMKTDAFLKKLNGNGTVFVSDTDNINQGYPILWYQAAQKNETCTVTVEASTGGTITVNCGAAVPNGTLVQLSSEAKPGYTLKTYLVNGTTIDGDFWTVTENTVFSAVFAEIRTCTVHIPTNEDGQVAVLRTGYRMDGNGMVWVEQEPLRDGDTLLQENVLTVSAEGYPEWSPADMNLEFTGDFTYAATNTEAGKSGSFTVTGDGDVTVTAERITQKKSWLTLADTDWYDHSGSYVISTAAELAGVAELVNTGVTTFAGETITLANDISLKNTDGTVGVRTWKTIGTTAERSFQGVLEGGGHWITDMTAWSEGSYAALFGYVKNAVLRNLTVSGTAACPAVSAYVSGIAACAEASVLESCDSRVNITVSGSVAGGVCAAISGGTVLNNCRNYGDITALSAIGGLAAVSSTGEDAIRTCFNFGTLTALGSGSSGTGGIVGKLTGSVADCGNGGNIVSAERYTGGIAGYTVGRNSARITGSTNTGKISVSATASNAAAGTLAGYAQYLTMENCMAMGTVEATADFPANGLGGFVGKAGKETVLTSLTVCETAPDFGYTEAPEQTVESKDSYTVTFMADGQIVSVRQYVPGGDAVEEPAVPEKAGYTGRWNRYCLGNADITVYAVYCQQLVHADETIKSGAYTLAYGEKGTLTIADGAHVTLSGSGNVLSVKVGSNVTLTLNGLTLTGEKTQLTLGENCRIVLTGENRISGRCDVRGNEAPTVSFAGQLTIEGSGSLRVEAGAGNGALYAAEGSLTLESGLLIVKKTELLGMDGGAVWTDSGTVSVTGGSLLIYTDSDNVTAIYADAITVSGGSLYARCSHAETVLDGAVTLSGGQTRLEGHSPQSSGENRDTYNETAAQNVTGSFYTMKQEPGSVCLSNQRITFNEAPVTMEVYNVNDENYFKLRDIAALMNGTDTAFSLDYDVDLKAMYARSGQRYAFVGGELQPGESKAETAVISGWRLYVDGILYPCQAVNVGGNNYFRLRDLGQALGFSVDWDEASRTVSITG